MHQLESTENCSAIKRTTNTGGTAAEAEWQHCHANTSSTTVDAGEPSRKHNGRPWERGSAGQRADADTCRSLSCFPWKIATSRGWTTGQILKSGCSRPNHRQYGPGADANSGAEGGGCGVYIRSLLLSFPFLSFPSFCYLCSISQISYVSRDQG